MPSRNKWVDKFEGLFWRFAVSGFLPAKWFQIPVPGEEDRAAKTGPLKLEIVSHCWNYHHLLVYQLASLVRDPPQNTTVRMTVFYAAEDTKTKALLDTFSETEVPGVTWNWQVLAPSHLRRRSIGRSQAALATEADWIWFADCDLMFRDQCLDALAEQLQGRRDILVYPREEQVTVALESDNPILHFDGTNPLEADVDADLFHPSYPTRATGPLQITHGDVARACGYCKHIKYYQSPADAWSKTYEDRAYRWLLGTQGTPIDFKGASRIRHVAKGRYTGSKLNSGIRAWIRRFD